MNSRELAFAVARKGGIDIQSAKKAVEAMGPVISEVLRNGGVVRLGSLGTFKQKKVAARKFRDIKTGEIRTSQPSKQLGFSAAAKYRKV